MLPESPTPRTRPTRPLGDKPKTAPERSRLFRAVINPIPTKIRFIAPDMSSALSVPVEPYLVLGRKEGIHDHDVHVDLGKFGAYKHGVSHVHAMILTVNNRVTLKDMHSMNGTAVNGHRLSASKEVFLNHGDKITLGKLTIMVAFAYDVD